MLVFRTEWTSTSSRELEVTTGIKLVAVEVMEDESALESRKESRSVVFLELNT